MTVFLIASLLVGTAQANDTPVNDNLSWDNPSSWEIPGKYVIDFEDDVSRDEISDLMDMFDLSYHDAPLWNDMKMEVVSSYDEAVLNRLRNHDDVEGVEPLIKFVTLGLSPNDPLYKQQWHMPRLGVESAWGLSIGRGVTVAVIDTGVACTDENGFHQVSDLRQTKCVAGYDFINNKEDRGHDDHGHGTHVAGTIAQSTNNGIGGVGVAFGVNIMPIKVLSGSGSGSNTGVAAGIRWAADNGAQIINMSLGSAQSSDIIQRAVNHAREQNVIIVAAAGNSGGSVGYPAACDGVIAVSATDSNDNLATFSSRGAQVDVAAPGVAITQQTICNGGRNGCEEFATWNGTSMASPHVAGVAALIVGLGVTDPDAVESYLKSTADSLDSNENSHYYGGGLVQADSVTQWVFWTQNGVRLVSLFVFSLLAFGFAKHRGEAYEQDSPTYWIGAVATSVGAFFLTFFLSRHNLWVDVLSRPVGDWSLLISANIHQYLPLANVAVPLALTGLFLKSHPGAAQWIAGTYVGTAAYLTSIVVLGQMSNPFGWTVTVAWCSFNAIACLFIASLLLVKQKTTA